MSPPGRSGRSGKPRSNKAKSSNAKSGKSQTGGRRSQSRSGSRGTGSGRDGGGRAGPPGGAKGRSAKGLGGQQVEGRQPVRELLLGQRRRAHEIWISSELQGSEAVEDIVIIAQAERVPVQYVARHRLEAEARSDAPQGVLAKAAQLPETPLHDVLRRRSGPYGPFLVAVDGVTDPRNLGAIVRSCEGAGVDSVVVPRHRAVHVTPTVAKASAGAIEYQNISLVSGLPSAIEEMRAANIWVIGLDDAAERSLFEIEEFATGGICIVLGAEGAGLSRLARARCDLIVSIPMLGHINSLNVSAAASLATYEVARHRL